jgi:hypothetical protein
MPETEGLGKTGWAALGLLLLGIGLVAMFGMAAAIYLGLIGTVVAMAIIVVLCLGDTIRG